MYSQLERTDIMVQKEDGTIICLQTDHREPAEIEAEREISTAFAICRVVNAARTAFRQGAPFEVHYTLPAAPPLFLHQAVAYSGGLVEVDNNVLPYQGPNADILQVLNGSLSDLAAQVSQRLGQPLTLEGLQAVQDHYMSTSPDQEEDETEYWTAVVELGAFAGEVMRGIKGGGWNLTAEDLGSLPIVFEGGPLKVNPMGKAIKFFDAGQEDSLVFLVQSAAAHMDQMGLTGQVPPPTQPELPRQQGPPPVYFGRPKEASTSKKKGLFGGLFGKK